MKIILVLIIYLFIFGKQNVFASTWVKNSNNPILSPITNSWEKQNLASPTLLKENNIYKMWYQGFGSNEWRIGYTTSLDGIHWNRDINNNLVIKPSDISQSIIGVAEPSVIHINNVYKMWFNAFSNNYIFKIYYAESSDGITWTIRGSPVLEGTTNKWDSNGVTNPSVLYDGYKYRMLYAAKNGSIPWEIGYAESSDGIQWTKIGPSYLNLPSLGFVGGPLIVNKNGKYHMWYHTGSSLNSDIYHVISNDGINWKCENNICSVLKIENNSFDSQGLTAPSIIDDNGKLLMYYSGFNGTSWQIGLATMDLTPVVIIPGLFGSWNNDAIIHNTDVSIFDWQISPFVKEYTGIINSLKNIGYTENKDFYIFPYDWRKSIENTTNDLDVFLTEKIWNASNEAKINIIGHSLGGIIGRIYTQKHPDKVNKIISVGSPHKGTALAYKPVEAGEIDTDNTLLWLAEKIILLLNKTTIETDRKTIQNRFSSLLDLFPTYNFLKDNDGNLLDTNNLQIKNPTLPNYNNNFSDIYSLFSAFYGNKTDLTTTAGYSVNPPSKIDQILGNYKDGRPKSSFQGPGDDTVLSLSATEEADLDSQIFNLDHGEIIYEKEAIKKIFDTSGISYTDSQIAEGAKTLIGPSIIFLIKSPAEIEVVSNSQTYTESDGIIFIPDAQTGGYTLNIKGKEKGRYTVIILSQNNSKKDYSFKIEGEIIQDPPTSQIDTYTISFDPVSDQSPVISSSTNPSFLIDELKLYLADLNKSLNKNEITKIISNLNQSKLYLQQNNFGRLKSNLLLIQQQLLSLRNKLSNNQDKQNIFYAITKLEDLNAKYLINYNQSVNKNKLKNDLNNYQKMISSIENYLIINQQRGKDVTKNGLILAEIKNRVDKIQQYLNMQKSTQAEFLLKTIEGLMKEVRN